MVQQNPFAGGHRGLTQVTPTLLCQHDSTETVCCLSAPQLKTPMVGASKYSQQTPTPTFIHCQQFPADAHSATKPPLPGGNNEKRLFWQVKSTPTYPRTPPVPNSQLKYLLGSCHGLSANQVNANKQLCSRTTETLPQELPLTLISVISETPYVRCQSKPHGVKQRWTRSVSYAASQLTQVT